MGTKESKHSNSISYEDSVKRGELPSGWTEIPGKVEMGHTANQRRF